MPERVRRRMVSIRIRPETWDEFKAKCEADGVKASAGVRRLVSLYLKELIRMPDANIQGWRK